MSFYSAAAEYIYLNLLHHSCLLEKPVLVQEAAQHKLVLTVSNNGTCCRKWIHGHGHWSCHDRLEANHRGHEYGFPSASLQSNFEQCGNATLYIRRPIQGLACSLKIDPTPRSKICLISDYIQLLTLYQSPTAPNTLVHSSNLPHFSKFYSIGSNRDQRAWRRRQTVGCRA